MVNDSAQGFYEGCGRLEWDRPPESAYSQVEHTIIVHYLEKYLPPKGLILDAGGGNGRYTIELAKRGYQVVLLDRSAAQLAIAKEEMARLPKEVRDNILDIVQGTIEDQPLGWQVLVQVMHDDGVLHLAVGALWWALPLESTASLVISMGGIVHHMCTYAIFGRMRI